MNSDANQVAESSTAAVAEPIEVEELNDGQREEWIKSGDLPLKETAVSDDSATSKPGKATEKTGAAKEAESGTAETKSDKQTRNWRALEKERDELKARLEKLEKPAGEKVAAPPAAEFVEPKPPERPKRPVLTEFKTTAEFDVAMDKYDTDMEGYSAKNRAYGEAKAQAEKTKTEIQAFNKQVEDKWKGMVEKATEKHPDFKDVALSNELAKQIPMGSPVDEWVLQAEVGAEMLYYLGQKPEELKRILALSRPAQHRELAKLEDTLAGTSKAEEKPKPKVVSSALAPPHEVGGKGVVAQDEEAQALKEGDTDRYMELANKRELAARKAGRR